MKKAGGSMTVIAYLEAQWPHDRIETRNIGGKLDRADGRIRRMTIRSRMTKRTALRHTRRRVVTRTRQ